jgi:hypothetical protein
MKQAMTDGGGMSPGRAAVWMAASQEVELLIDMSK